MHLGLSLNLEQFNDICFIWLMNEQDPGFEILHEDNQCLLVLKPGGVLTQAPPGIDSMEVRIKRFLKAREEKTGNIYLGIPHRLDRPVSGVMAFAKNVRAARRITEQFAGRLATKKYWAIVEGVVEEDEATWNDYMHKIPGQAQSEIVDKNHPDGRHATLHFRALERVESRTLLEIELETGRTHQIRVQCSSRGFPIMGDSLYGATISFGPQVSDLRARWIALHARFLEIRHPKTKELIAATAPLPEAWRDVGFELPE